MLSAILLSAAVASADTQPVNIMLAGEPRTMTEPRAVVAPVAKTRVAKTAVAMTPLASAMARPKRFNADSIVLDKSERRLKLYQQGTQVLAYDVALGPNPVGAKIRRGDGRTPEGLYYLEGRNPQSKYHLSLRVSYPNATDRVHAANRGVAPGGDIMIHGLPKAFASVGALHRQQDWTEGCIAVTNDEIEEIWRNVAPGARILIKP